MPHLHPAGQALTFRRKRALEETNFITHDVDGDERDRTTARVQRQRTSSTTSVETIRVRPTTKAKLPVLGLGVGKPLVALTIPKPLPPSSVGSKIPIPTSAIKSSTRTPPRDDKPPKSILKKPKLANLGPAAQSVPVIVRQPAVYQHEPLVVDEPRVIVDEPRVEEDMDSDAELLKLQMDVDMDMDTIPCIPSPPDSPPLRASGAPQSSARDAQPGARDSPTGDVRNTPSASPAPPPPTPTLASTGRAETSNSSSTSVSTVKGTKKRHSNSSNKAKTPSIFFPSIDAKGSSPIDAKTKGGKTKPLVALCPNTSFIHPLAGRSSQAQGKSSTHIRTKSSDSSPLSTKSSQGNDPQECTKQPQKSMVKIDKWGCVHLGAVDCELAMTFPQPHCEIWDMRDDVCIACAAVLHLTPKDPARWDATPLSMPDVSLMDIQCNVVVPSSTSAHDPNASYHTQFKGAEIGRTSTDCPPKVTPDSITVEGRWVRASSHPPTDAKKKDDPSSGKTKHKSRSSLAQALGIDLDLDIIPEPSKEQQELSRGWFLKIWIPIPTRLFVKKETRVFKVVAKVWMMGDEDLDFTYLDAQVDREEGGTSEDGLDKDTLPLVAVGEMTVSHLRGERMLV